MAEIATQALLIDVNDVTFTAAETSADSSAGSERPERRAYYSILDMGDADMRTSYMIKPREAYLAQVSAPIFSLRPPVHPSVCSHTATITR